MTLATSDIVQKLKAIGLQIARYKLIIFVVFVAGIYGFVVLRISTLTSITPSADAVTAQSDPIRAAHIDPSVVKQLQSLQDHSVNVQTLFQQARDNPFQE